jgi:excisionase family DNA binding protein
MSDIFSEEKVNNFPDGFQFFTYDEVARILKVKRATIRSWVYLGEIKRTVKMGKKTLIPKEELQRFIAERTNKAKKPKEVGSAIVAEA